MEVSGFGIVSSSASPRRQQAQAAASAGSSSTSSSLRMSSPVESTSTSATELPDSLEDAAEIAARACSQFFEASGPTSRCRIDFDTSAGDETYTLLKSSTEFMQKFVSAVSYQFIDGLQQQRQQEMQRVVEARTELQQLLDAENSSGDSSDEAENEEEESSQPTGRKQELIQILNSGGRDADFEWKGPKVRIYMPDEGSAALARRDWNPMGNPQEALVPPCVEFSSCGGVQTQDVSNDQIVLFFCPKASEAEYVEELLVKTEEQSTDLKLTVFVNPNLVDMGVTGFGMAGRMLRERLIDPLQSVYYLRTLQWGALTRVWPQAFSVWQEDEDADGGYRLISALPYLPSNPEVEDIYDEENSSGDEKKGGGLDGLSDFISGMMRL